MQRDINASLDLSIIMAHVSESFLLFFFSFILCVDRDNDNDYNKTNHVTDVDDDHDDGAAQ